MIDKKRWTLRPEYFGGIIHDAVETTCEILNPRQFDLLKNLDSEEGRKNASSVMDVDQDFYVLGGKLMGKGAVDEDFNPIDIRLVEHPIPLPEGTLASPIRVYDTYGYGCNLSCKRCLNESSREKLDANRRTLDQTKAIMEKFYEAGTMEWRFTGGEPTMYEDLPDAIAIAKSYGMGVMLNTNGCWNDELYESLLNSGLSEVIVSIEGPEEVNDRLRAKGVYRHIVKTLDAIKEHNESRPDKKIRTTLNMTVGKENSQHVEDIVKMGAKYRCNVNFVPTRPYGRATVDDLLSTEEFMKFSENVQQLRGDPEVKKSGVKVIHRNMDLFNNNMPDKRKNPLPFNYSSCGALATGFGLSPDGRVNACSFLAGNPEYVGLNLAESGITVYDAWLDPKMERIRKAERQGCTPCGYYKQQCEGKCLAMVLAEGGKIENGKIIGRDRYCFAPLMKRTR
jgi:radical SAM protein with 4Fe4S-binding SPASM domain